MRSRLSSLLVLAYLVCVSVAGAADTKGPESPETAKARAEFVKGADFVHKAQWSEALAAFELSSKIKPHAVTTYNIGACERALGRYALARKTLKRALSENDVSGGVELPQTLIGEVRAYINQIDSLLATAEITLDPPTADIAVDGRPLDAEAAAGPVPVLVAGIREPGPGEPPPAARFQLVLDPGVHVLTLSRKGYAEAIVNRTFIPGSTAEIPLALDRLPALMHIGSNQDGSIVTVNGADVGIAPVDVSRPAGSYRVVVRKTGFVTYEAQVNARAGEELELRAKLSEETHALTGRWWFWTALGVAVVGAGAGTYFATRSSPAPERPPLNCGGLGWCVQAQ